MTQFSEVTEPAIAVLVDQFYDRVRRDPMIGPVFEAAIDDWGEHLAKLSAFWSSVMLTSGSYKGNPMAVHMKLALFFRPGTPAPTRREGEADGE
jgi:hemoglobin